MPSRAQLTQRLARLEKQVAERERAAYYAQPVTLDRAQYTLDEKRAIVRTLLQVGAMYGRATTQGVSLLSLMGLTCGEIEQFCALYAEDSNTAQVEWLAAWHEQHHPTEETNETAEPAEQSAVAS